eukprot:Clim_evm19s136 gene=Clim_evmTU19s136
MSMLAQLSRTVLRSRAMLAPQQMKAGFSSSAFLKVRYFSEEHEWLDVNDGVGTLGITNFAQDQLGDVVYVELAEVGNEYEKGQECGAVESVKAASEIYAPISGEVVEVNEDLVENPGLVNSSPEADGWMCKIKLSDPSELDDMMDEAAYDAFVKGQS